MIRCYHTTCQRAGCGHEAWVEEPGDAPRRVVGAAVTCDCGQPCAVRLTVPPAIGILTEHYDPQTKRTFTSNRQYEDWKNYGDPVVEDGEVVGFRKIREYSHAELDAQDEAGWREAEEDARTVGRTLEEDARFRADCINEKRTKEIEQGLKPTVAPATPESLLPA